MSEGVRRLAIFAGGMGVAIWLTFAAIQTDFFSEGNYSIEFWVFIVGISVPCFLAPFGVVHSVAWVIRGFKKTKVRDQT